MPENTLTQEQILDTIRAARDSVWVISDSLAKLASGAELTADIRGNIERNVSHLKLIVANPEISGSGQDISDLHTAITNGEAALA
jgi:hypothetical protein